MRSITHTCGVCGSEYRDRPERIGRVGFCSRACRDSQAGSEARFWSYVDKTASNGCWLWTGGKGAGGYGKARFFGATALAHRVSYLLVVGPVMDGLQLDHLCRNRACCNHKELDVPDPDPFWREKAQKEAA